MDFYMRVNKNTAYAFAYAVSFILALCDISA